jgi:hypothetical protein
LPPRRAKNEVEIFLSVVPEVPHFVIDAEFNSAHANVLCEQPAPTE